MTWIPVVWRKSIIVIVVTAFLVLGACATSPPDDISNVCSIFKEKRGWYSSAKRSQKRWGMPIHVQMAIIHQESRFRSNAKPPRKKFLWIIPAGRKSSAYGYGQALDGTWKQYIKDSGNRGADRDKFADAVDFIGWYGNQSAKKLGISKWNAKHQYLAYHEGHGGYQKRTYRKKKWLLAVGDKVDRNARRYRSQLAGCESKLKKGWRLWPF